MLGGASLVAILLALWGGYHLGKIRQINAIPKVNTPGYVIGEEASDHVASFFTQYINPKTVSVDTIINGYGDKNLAFYRSYYQHNFDPITCSSVKALKVTPVGGTSGPTSTVTTKLEYADNSSQLITSNVVLNNDGIKIDSITCPANKGGLPPQ